jgi:hypothetical protein
MAARYSSYASSAFNPVLPAFKTARVHILVRPARPLLANWGIFSCHLPHLLANLAVVAFASQRRITPSTGPAG